MLWFLLTVSILPLQPRNTHRMSDQTTLFLLDCALFRLKASRWTWGWLLEDGLAAEGLWCIWCRARAQLSFFKDEMGSHCMQPNWIFYF